MVAADIFVVSQRDRRFSPDRLTVAPDDIVRVMNDDRVTHHVYIDSADVSFDSGEQPVGKNIDLHFTKSGVFTVRCAIHPTMRLTVTVK